MLSIIGGIQPCHVERSETPRCPSEILRVAQDDNDNAQDDKRKYCGGFFIGHYREVVLFVREQR